MHFLKLMYLLPSMGEEDLQEGKGTVNGCFDGENGREEFPGTLH